MRFEGNNTRKLTEQKSVSFVLNKSSINNLTGDVYFGFSGEGQTLQFKFDKGKIYDPENNYVYSYYPSKNFILSGEISETHYNYSINGVNIIRGKSKGSFKIENWFINATDCSLEATLSILSDGISHTFDLQDSVIIGDSVSAQITNNSSDGKLHIFDATLRDTTSKNYRIISFPSEIDHGATESFVFDSIASSDGYHPFEMDLDTNVGKISIKDSILSAFPERIEATNQLKLFASGTLDNLIFDDVNGEEFIMFLYSSTIYGASDRVQEVIPSLEYSEGNVGDYHRVTGVNIIDNGEGYSSTPTVRFFAGQGNDVQAGGTAIMSGDKVVGVDVTNSGIYSGNIPEFLWFDGSSTTPADGQVLVETYQKTFSECWDIYTGSSLGELTSFGEAGLTGNQGDSPYDHVAYGPGIYQNPNKVNLSSGENLYIKIKGKSLYDFDIIKAKLKITGTLKDTNTNRLSEEITISSQNIT